MKYVKEGAKVAIILALFAVSGVAMAQGVDTATSSLTSLKTWVMTWIPIAAALMIIGTAIAWIAHMIRADWALRITLGLIVVGSAAYIVGFFGL